MRASTPLSDARTITFDAHVLEPGRVIEQGWMAQTTLWGKGWNTRWITNVHVIQTEEQMVYDICVI